MNASFILVDIVIMIIIVARPGGNGGTYANKVLLNSTLEQAALADALFYDHPDGYVGNDEGKFDNSDGNHHHRPHH